MRYAQLFLALLLGGLSSPERVLATDPSSIRPTEPGHNPIIAEIDRTFMEEVGRMAVGEMKTSQMALNDGASPGVRALAQTIIDYHEATDSKLDLLAGSMGMQLPEALDHGREQFVAQLDAAEGIEFDRTYLKGQLTDHQQSIKLFEQEASFGRHSGLREFAHDHLMALRRNGAQVEALAAELD